MPASTRVLAIKPVWIRRFMLLKQFAASLSLSKTTNSRALDCHPDVAPETRERVPIAPSSASTSRKTHGLISQKSASPSQRAMIVLKSQKPGKGSVVWERRRK